MPASAIDINLVMQSSTLQPRAKMDTATIDEYTEAMKAGSSFPPVTVFQVDKDLYLVDGYHRYLAARGANIPKISAEVRIGTMREAILFSAGANAKHGVRRNNEDKRRAVLTLLKDKEWGNWADTKIAETCSVSADLVADVRDSILGKTDRYPLKKRKVERAGKVFKMDTTRIGKNHPAAVQKPDTSQQLPPPKPQPFTRASGSPSSVEQPLPRSVRYPLLSKDEWYSATADFMNGCLKERYHRIVQDIREARPKEYPSPLDVIAKGLELAAEDLLQDGV